MQIFHAFFKSLYSPTYIGRFRFIGIGKTIGYIFFLMLIVTIPASIIVTQTFLSTTTHVKDAIAVNLPDFIIEDGQLHSEEETSLFLQQNDFEVIFDSTGEVQLADIEGKEVIALLKEDVYIASAGESYTFRYDQAGNISLTKDDIHQFIESLTQLIPIIIPVYLIIVYLFSTGLKFIGITVLSFIGYLFKNLAPISLSYRHIWILAAYVVTLPTVVSTVMDMISISSFPFASIIVYWGIAIVMLIAVFKKLPTPKRG